MRDTDFFRFPNTQLTKFSTIYISFLYDTFLNKCIIIMQLYGVSCDMLAKLCRYADHTWNEFLALAW